MPAPPLCPIVIWFGRVGDMTLLSALLEILHRRYGGRCHVIGAGAWTAEIYAAQAAVARVTCLGRYTAFLFDGAWWRALWALRTSRGAPVYVCESGAGKLARIRRLLRFSGIDPARCLFLSDVDSIRQRHWVDRLVSFARLTPRALCAADYPWPSPPPLGAPHLQVSAEARAQCTAWLEARGWAGRTLLLVQPGNHRTMRGRRLRPSTTDDKAWPVERWAELLQRMHAHMPQALIVLCGAPRESLLLAWIAAAAQLPAAVAVAELPLAHLFALCEQADSMISVDTGPAHAAAALSLPLVVLFGANFQSEWLPRSPSGSTVVGLGGPPHSNRLDQIAVEAVFAAWRSVPGRAAAAAAAHPVTPGGTAAQTASSERHSPAITDRRKRGSGPTKGRDPARQLPMRSM